MIKPIIVLFLMLSSFKAFTQINKIDTISFSLDNKLLVFKASINDTEVDFAFDTGASLGLSNSSIQSSTGLIVKNGSQTITDANLKRIKINNTVIKKMQIGSHLIDNIKGAIYDMELLTCHKFYLLGMDVIGRLNWKIDFNKQQILVSKNPFPTNNYHIEIPVSNTSHRPQTSLVINGINYPNCLIDLGYTGSITISENEHLNKLYQQILGTGKSGLSLNSNMSVTGLGKADTVKTIQLDKIKMGQYDFNLVNTTVYEKTDFKIGIEFFSTQTKEFILNHTTGKYYIEPKINSEPLTLPLDARVSYQEGKLLVTALNLNKNSSAKQLSIGETIKSINGKQASDFNDNCQFLLEFYHTKKTSIQIEKLDGTLVTIQRSTLE
jgi:hypothetical protein